MNDQPAKPVASEQRYRANLQGEVDGAQLYRSLADAEPDPKVRERVVALARRLLDWSRGARSSGIVGAYLIPPFKRYEEILDLFQ